MNLKSKKVLVTGSSSGIGKAIAIACAQQGAYVVVHYRKNKEGAEKTLKEVESVANGIIVSADLADPDQVEKMFQQLKEQNNADLDVLINNAGEALQAEFDDFKAWEAQWKNIFMSQVYVTNAFINMANLKDLRKIVNVS